MRDLEPGRMRPGFWWAHAPTSGPAHVRVRAGPHAALPTTPAAERGAPRGHSPSVVSVAVKRIAHEHGLETRCREGLGGLVEGEDRRLHAARTDPPAGEERQDLRDQRARV